MPVVLVEVGAVARSGHFYGDRTGISYEYPKRRYSSYVHTGDRFVYQKPGVGYFGCGVIGEIRQSSHPDRLVCDVLSVSMFDVPVGLKDAMNVYYEADTRFWKDKVYWGQGVRPLSSERFESIVATADALATSASLSTGSDASLYAGPETARAVADYALLVAVERLYDRFGEPVTAMPISNPGFKLRVGAGRPPTRYAGVKGTQSYEPTFSFSEGERRFSIRNARRYTLLVVTGIDLNHGSHGSVLVHDGALGGSDLELRATRWRGWLSTDASASN